MTGKRAKLVLAALTTWVPAATMHAFVPRPTSSFGKSVVPLALQERVLRTELEAAPANFNKSTGLLGASRILRDRISGEIRSLSGSFPEYALKNTTDKKAFIELAQRFIDSHPELFGLSSQDLQVVDDAVFLGTSEQFIKFAVYRQGLPIVDAGIDFRFKNGKLVQIINEGFAEAVSASDEVLTDLDLPLRTVTAASADTTVTAGALFYRVKAEPKQKKYTLVKVQAFTLQDEGGEQLAAQVEAATGKIFEIKDTHLYYGATVKGQAYKRWFNEPLQSQALPFVQVATTTGSVHTDNHGKIRDAGTQAPTLRGLSGHFVSISPVSGGSITQTAELEQNRWNMALTTTQQESAWLDKYTAQLMVYNHTNAVVAYAKRYINHEWLNRPLKTNVNLTRSCNAHWDGTTTNFYSGSAQCANTGLIADVIYHEWGHGLDAKTGGIADGAFSEGFGDIISLAMTRSNKLGIGFRLPNFEPVRDLEPDKIYPRDRGEVHAEGLIIGSTFWDLYKELAKKYGEDTAADKIANFAFKMIFTAARYTQVYDAVLVIDDNDGNLGNRTPNWCLINRVFAQHGLAKTDASCKVAAVEGFELSDPDHDGVMEPGETVALKVLARNSGAETVTGLTGTLSLKEGSGVTIEAGALSWDALAPQQVLASQQEAVLTLSPDATCGSSFTTSLQLQTPEQSVVLEQEFTLGKNMGTPESFSGGDLPVAIRDMQTSKSSLTVSEASWTPETKIQAATVKFAIKHSYIGDLSVKLLAPDGSSHELFQGDGDGDDINFEQDISPLLKGLKGAGTWSLSVYDKATRDEGTLESFELRLTPHKFLCD